MVLTAYFVLSPAIGLVCHRRLRIKVLTRPGRARKTSADLTPASRRQDHTTSPSASNIGRLRAVDRSRETRPAIPSRAQRCRVHRIPPRVRDDRASAPLWDGTAKDINLIWVSDEEKYFCKQGWTANSLICPTGQITLLCRVDKGALAPRPPFPFRDVGGHAEFIIGRAFARPVGFAHGSCMRLIEHLSGFP